MHDARRPNRQQAQYDTLLDALRAGGSVKAAAELLNIPPRTFYQRARRCGLTLRWTQWAIEQTPTAAPVEADAPPEGGIRIVGGEVHMSLADYALLKSQALGMATLGDDALHRRLQNAERIIESLSRALEACGGRKEQSTTW